MAITAEIDICNMALMRCGSNKPILSLQERSAAAEACSTFYTNCRDRVLEAYPWPFATRRARLVPLEASDWAGGTAYAVNDLVNYGDKIWRALTATTGDRPDESPANWTQITRDGWGYVCEVPADFVLAQYVAPFGAPMADSSQRTPFKIEESDDGNDRVLLLTNESDPVLVYTCRIETFAILPASFASAVAWLLASELYNALRSDPDGATKAFKAYLYAVGDAASNQQRGQREEAEPASEFTLARER